MERLFRFLPHLFRFWASKFLWNILLIACFTQSQSSQGPKFSGQYCCHENCRQYLFGPKSTVNNFILKTLFIRFKTIVAAAATILLILISHNLLESFFLVLLTQFSFYSKNYSARKPNTFNQFTFFHRPNTQFRQLLSSASFKNW